MEPVPEPPPLTFAGLLRELRAQAGLTQDGLASAASLSPRSISDLERGINLTTRQETARLLAAGARPDWPGQGRLRSRGSSGHCPASAAAPTGRSGRGDPDPASRHWRIHRAGVGAETARGLGGEYSQVRRRGGDSRHWRHGGRGQDRARRACRAPACRNDSLTGRCSCHCTRTRQGSGQPILARPWPACCLRRESRPGRSRLAWKSAAACGATGWRESACSSCSTTRPGTTRCGSYCPAPPAAWS